MNKETLSGIKTSKSSSIDKVRNLIKDLFVYTPRRALEVFKTDPPLITALTLAALDVCAVTILSLNSRFVEATWLSAVGLGIIVAGDEISQITNPKRRINYNVQNNIDRTSEK